eukprot:TRINITY_DN91944_c0_g1_i1.p1 TRINITY_DN91944_c0_g1~~TRINITY_DN91944_c0_g1_i1.p1  ORF type:complete len:342 (-),score=68.20 TRINITY_DN91944_c0_g1_i1:321-1346(-)
MTRLQWLAAMGLALPACSQSHEAQGSKETKELATVWNPSKCSATLFGGELDDPRYWHATFRPGDYSMRDLERHGARNDQTSAIRVKGAGCEVTVFGGELDDLKSWQYTFTEGEYNFDDRFWQKTGVVNNDMNNDISSIRVLSPDRCAVTLGGGKLDQTDAWAVTFKDGAYKKADFKAKGAKSKVTSVRVFGEGCAVQLWADELDDAKYFCETFPEGEYDRGILWRTHGYEEYINSLRVTHAADMDDRMGCRATGQELLEKRVREGQAGAAHTFFFYVLCFCGASLVGLFACKRINDPQWSPMDLEHELNIGRSANDGIVASMSGAFGLRNVQRPDDGYWLG